MLSIATFKILCIKGANIFFFEATYFRTNIWNVELDIENRMEKCIQNSMNYYISS